MKALVGAFNQEKALVGAFSVIVQPVVEPMEHCTALCVSLTVHGALLAWGVEFKEVRALGANPETTLGWVGWAGQSDATERTPEGVPGWR